MSFKPAKPVLKKDYQGFTIDFGPGFVFKNEAELTLDRLYELSFPGTLKVIPTLTAEQKLEWGEFISNDILPPLYEGARQYEDGVFRMDQEYISPQNFQRILGKIKHWESILTMMYESDIINELDLDEEV